MKDAERRLKTTKEYSNIMLIYVIIMISAYPIKIILCLRHRCDTYRGTPEAFYRIRYQERWRLVVLPQSGLGFRGQSHVTENGFRAFHRAKMSFQRKELKQFVACFLPNIILRS